MATGTDPLQRDPIRIVSQDTGDRLVAPKTNAALRLADALGDIAPDVAAAGQAIAEQAKSDAEANAQRDALSASGREMSDAVRLGLIRPSQNPWYVQAYERESGAIRGTDAMSQLQTESASWAEKADPVAFAKRWHDEVAKLAPQFGGTPDTFKGFNTAQAQTTQQVLATNQAFNAQRIETERENNLSMLAADALQRQYQANAGHVTGSEAAQALAPAKAQWLATGGTIEGWNKLAISAVTTASYSVRSPGLIDLLKAPELINGPREGDTFKYGDGTEAEAHPPAPTDPLAPLPAATPGKAPQAAGPAVSTRQGLRLALPVTGPVTNTFAQHEARGSRGVDIAVPTGSKVMTPVGGVATVGQDARSGLFVKITSPDGKIISSYAHLSVAQVQNGEHVAPGAVVARSGQTGHATGPHVHWRLRVDGQDVDPLSYRVAQQETDQQQAPVASGEATPELAPAAPQAQQPQVVTTTGPSLYDIAGVADSAESDRYRIRSAVNNEAQDRLQAIVAQRKLDGLTATDRLYSTFGSKLLTGDVDLPTIVNTLTKGGYSPQVIAEAVNNVRGAVGDSEALQAARFGISSQDPTQGKHLYDLATEGRLHGYSDDYERRVGQEVINGTIKPEEGISLVSTAVSRSEQIKAENRADTRFQQQQDGQPPAGVPGQIIRKSTQVKGAIDQYATVTALQVSRLLGRQMTKGESDVNKTRIKQIVMEHLLDHPGDYAGAEQEARDYLASFLSRIAATKGHQLAPTTSTTPAAAGGNPRR